MLFILSRFMQYMVLPPSSLLILMAGGFLIIRKNRFAGRLLIASGFILLYLLSIHPVTDSLLAPLERSVPTNTERNVTARALVVLGGGVRDVFRTGIEPEPSAISLERVVKGVTCYRTLHIPMILVGGSGDLSKTGAREADAMARAARDLGVPEQDIVIENTARNTLESARAVKKMINGNRIMLISSAFHLKRAAALFKKQGFEVIAVPAGFYAERTRCTFSSFVPQAGNLHASSMALSEYISYAWYAICGDL
jgi:uncharacterized SAM-binding protein YcdF (DUF218 family)